MKQEDEMAGPTPKRRSWRRIGLYAGLAVVALAGLAYAFFELYLGAYLSWFQPAARPEFAQYVPGIQGIQYVAKVDDGFYRGADPSEALAQLKRLGIKTIVNFRYQDEHDYEVQARIAGFDYHWISFRPSEAPTRTQVKKFLAIALDPAHRPVYIHCAQGIDRTGVMAGIYRIEHDGWTNEAALAEMNWFGHFRGWRDVENCLKGYPASLRDE
jgi:protein tyrosine phosphatase (PTP) superfamily phosphohydrolase (DUF442 family)